MRQRDLDLKSQEPGKLLIEIRTLMKDPYVLDFLGLTDRFLERDLEDAILRELEIFLLELGAGFSFVARQKRIQLDGTTFTSTCCSTTANSSAWWS